ncbi:hypothetical protein GCM10009838_60380 [Catenulispora subtropica]|uniref:LPXTG-motif cell wall anchor domain protein n=1 Tax=Catenulispora subtropica TaxID=450798 RepID=A0ABN2SN23_9ACTN
MLAAGLTAGLAVAGAMTAEAAAAADDGSGPVATPPATPAVQTVSGVAANGVQLTLTLPRQLPVDLPGRQLAGREIDVTAKDTAGQGYTGAVDTTLTAEGGGVTRMPLRVERYDADTADWRPVPVGPAVGTSLNVSVQVAVPAGGSQQVRLRVSPGTTVLDDVKVAAAANGATAVGTAPVTEPTFRADGLTAAVQAGTPLVVTGRLANPTDVDYAHVPVKLYLKACPQTGKCFGAADIKLEAQVGGSWQTVPVDADPSVTGGVSGTVFPDLALPAGGSVQLTARMTLNSGTAAVNPVPLGFGPIGLTIADRQSTGGTLTVQPVAAPTPTATSTTSPSATPSDSASSPSDPASSATGTPTATPSATPATATAATPDTALDGAPVAAGTPSASTGSASATILVAAGLFAVCLALVLWFVLMKRRERLAAAAAGHGADHDADDEV